MEKYTDWRDKGTGISPFLPPTKIKLPFWIKSIRYVCFVVKLILVLPIVITFPIMGYTTTLLQFIFKVLFSLDMDVNVQGVRKRLIKRKLHYPHVNASRPKLYMVNYTSALNALVCNLLSQGPALFLIPKQDTIYVLTMSQFINYTLDGSLDVTKFGVPCNSDSHDVINFLANNVCFMFPEGTCSNGKSVLPLEITENALRECISEETELIPIQIKLNQSLTTPMAQSKLNWFNNLILVNQIHVKCKIGENTTYDQIRTALNNQDKYKLVNHRLNLQSKIEFVTRTKA